MEALAGLSVAVNVMQVISFTRETAELCAKLYQEGSIDENLDEGVTRIQALGQDLESKLKQSTPILNQKKNVVNQRLVSLCNEVVSTANELSTRLKPPANGKREIIKTVARYRFRESAQIKTLDKRLSQLEKTLQTELLIDIWSKEDARLIQQQEGFSSLNQEVQDTIRHYAQGQIDINEILRQDFYDTIALLSKQLERQLSIGFDKTIQHVTAVVRSAEELQSLERQKQQFLSSVRFPARNARKTAVHSAHEKTFEWIFDAPDDDEHSAFRKWLVSDEDPVFWIQGKPGSGKSTLMKFIVSSKRTSSLLSTKHARHALYSHFIWMADHKVDGTSRGLLCSLIHQVLEAEKNDDMVHVLIQQHPEFRRRQDPRDWELIELQLVLQELLTYHSGFVFVFIDGLDELIASEDKFNLKDFVEATLSKADRVKLCISSRPEPMEKLIFEGFPSMRLQDLTRDDMQKVAQGMMSEYFKFSLRSISEEKRLELVNKIVSKAEGVFLWITLALTRIKRGSIACATYDDLSKSIGESPSELTDLYRKMWDRLGDNQAHHQQTAALILSIILDWEIPNSDTPLNVFHLTICLENDSRPIFHELMASGPGFFLHQKLFNDCLITLRHIDYVCAGLIEFRKPDEWWVRHLQHCILDQFPDAGLSKDDPRGLAVGFVHRSLRDFLIGDGQAILYEPDARKILDASFHALIADAMITQSHTTWCSTRLCPYDIDHGRRKWLYQYHIRTSEINISAELAFISCRRLMETSEVLGESGYNRTESRTRYYERLLESVFRHHQLDYFLEKKGAYFDFTALAPCLPNEFASLQTYLFWQRLSSTSFVEVPEPIDNLEELFEMVEMKWAYPHTLTVGDNCVPQLLTIPEFYLTKRVFGTRDHLLIPIKKLLKDPKKLSLYSLGLTRKSGLTKPTLHGVRFLTTPKCRTAETDQLEHEHYDIIYRMNATAIANRFVRRQLAITCLNAKPSALYETELRALLRPESEEKLEVIMMIVCRESSYSTRNEIMGFEVSKLYSFFRSNLGAHSDYSEYDAIRRCVHPRFFRPSKDQSEDILHHLDPDLLHDTFNGPYDVCGCVTCSKERKWDQDPREESYGMQKRHIDRVSPIRSIIDEICATSDDRIDSVPEYLRQRGHYIPTEDDLLEFLEAKSTFDRISVLDRLNENKAKHEAWMNEL